MATDNTQLNLGTGGDLVRTLADSSNAKWNAAVTCYATTISPGANVLQVVDASNGLPVAIQNGASVGTAGTPSTDVVTVQGAPGMTKVTVGASDETSTIYEGDTPLTPIFASFTLSSSGPTSIVAPVSGKIIRILRYSLSFSATANFNFQSHTTTSTVSGIKYGVANIHIETPYCPLGIFQTVVSEGLDGNISASGPVSGDLLYVLV
jgi:hypothetical protein